MRPVPLAGPSWPSASDALRDLRFYAPGADPDLAGALARADAARAAGEGRALREALAALGATLTPIPGASPPGPPCPVPTDAEVARVTLDRAPDAGETAPWALLGPWADVLDRSQPGAARAWTAAVAAASVVLHDDDDRSPMRSFLKELRRAPLAERARRPGWLALFHAPLAPWRLVGGDAGFGVEPLAPLGEAWVPRGPVVLEQAGDVVGTGPVHGGLLLARLLATPAGTVACTAFLLPEPPPAPVLEGALVDLLTPLRAHTRALHVEDALRGGGHRLVAACHAWAWSRYGAGAAAGAARNTTRRT